MRPPLRRVLPGAVALTCLAAASGCGGGADTPPVTAPPGSNDTVVKLEGLVFVPEEVRVPTGGRVLWQWTDEVVHNVISETFRSATQGGGSYAHTFDKPGTYRYQCTLHTGMIGRVVVG